MQSRASADRRHPWALTWALLVISIILISRVLALTSGPWEWDEMLFVSAVADYDILEHRPHPPGYPLFIAAAKIVRPVVTDEFRALQTITLAGALLLPLGLWRLLTVLGFTRFVSVGSALTVSFIPVIWFYGGTAFSDVPALAITIFAAASLADRDRSWRTDLVSALWIAAIAAFRPQNVMIVAPFVVHAIATSAQRWRSAVRIGGGAVLGGIAIYTAAFMASGSLLGSLEVMGKQAEYVVDVDSIRSETRPPIGEAWEDFVLDSYPTDAIAWGLFALAVTGLVRGLKRSPKAVVLLLSAFLPLAAVSLILLDVDAAERYSLSYVPLVGILAVLGIDAVAAALDRHVWQRIVRIGLLAMCVALLAWRTWFAIDLIRRSPTPPMAALSWVLERVDEDDLIVVDRGLQPFARAYLPRYEVVDEYRGDPRDGYLIETDHTVVEATHFKVEQETLKRIARRRYFDIWVSELDLYPQFRQGWYDLEWDGRNRTASRWMSGAAIIGLPAGAEPRCSMLRFDLPGGVESQGVTGAIAGGSVMIERTENEETMLVRLSPCDGCLRELQLLAEPFVPAQSRSNDTRELGARLLRISVEDCDRLEERLDEPQTSSPRLPDND